MASERKYIKTWLRWLSGYEKYAYKRLMKVFRKWIYQIPWGEMNQDNYESIIYKACDQPSMNIAYYDIYYNIGMSHGPRVGASINLQVKNFILNFFATAFETMLASFLATWATKRIVTVRKSFCTQVINIIADRFDNNQDVHDVSKEITKAVARKDFYQWQALRIARTEAVAAANYSALQAGEGSGFVLVKRWLSAEDKRTRVHPKDEYDHLEMNGKPPIALGDDFVLKNKDGAADLLQFPGDPKGQASNVINCYLPNTIISSNITQGQRSFYSGEIVEIITRRGERLAITPNHGVLTENGFIKANSIKIGDNLICNKVNTNPIFRLINNYIKKELFTAQNIFSTLNKFWFSEKLVVTALDFDTDGKSMNGNIDIVYPKIKLRNRIIPAIFKSVNKFNFKAADPKRTIVMRNSPFNLFSNTNKATFCRFVSFLYLAFPSCFRHFRPLESFRFGLAAHLNTKRFKSPRKSNPSDSTFVADLIKTDPRLIAFDEVVNIRYFDFSGHVYDFSSVNGVNIANNIYTSNCRCAVSLLPFRDKSGNLVPLK